MSARELDEKDFVREKLHGGGKSALVRYRDLVVGADRGWLALVQYELITMVFGLIPGALGIVLRRFFYRFLFASVGRKTIFGRNLTIRCAHNIRLGESTFVDDDCLLDGRGAGSGPDGGVVIGARAIINRGVTIKSKVGPIHIGDDVTIGAGTTIVAQGGVYIGDWVSFAGVCKVSGGVFEPRPEGEAVEGGPPFRRVSKGPIRIGKNTVLSHGATVVDAVTVGESCMIGPGSILLKDVPDGATTAVRPPMVLKRTAD